MKPTKPPVIGNYHYDEVIGLSLEFYEAQRTGQLPTDNRIWWRGDSFVDDGKANGLDLSGGYFDGNVVSLAWCLLYNLQSIKI